MKKYLLALSFSAVILATPAIVEAQVSSNEWIPCQEMPALIQRSSHVHPASALTDVGLRIRRLQIHHPEPSKVRAALAAIHLSPEPEVTILHADACHLVAEIDTPAGAREIGLN